jgi:glycerol-3-phosphate dehydrogenase
MIASDRHSWGYGGKLTTYRATAECVMQRVLPVLPGRGPLADPPQHYPLMRTRRTTVVAMEND